MTGDTVNRLFCFYLAFVVFISSAARIVGNSLVQIAVCTMRGLRILGQEDVMRVLVWTGLLLVLTVICSVTGLARMIGMPIEPLLWGAILMLAGLVGGLGLALIVRPEPRLVPIRLAA